MRLYVSARPGAGKEVVEDLGEGKYKVWVREPAEKGSANKAIIYAIAKHVGVAQSQIKIVLGHTSRNKVLEVVK